MSNELIIVLGTENSSTGTIGVISKSRLDNCLEIYEKGDLILCTGGWGSHFNTTKIAHAIYAQKYLIQKGVLKSDLLTPALSSNTVDDAVKVKEIIKNLKHYNFTLITSDFHLQRAKIIFNEILEEYDFSFIGAKIALNAEEQAMYIAHETKAVANILKNGLYY